MWPPTDLRKHDRRYQRRSRQPQPPWGGSPEYRRRLVQNVRQSIPDRRQPDRRRGTHLRLHQHPERGPAAAARLRKGEWQTRILTLNMLDLNEDPLVVLEPEGRIVIANNAFADILESLPEKIKGKDLFEFKSRILDQPNAGPTIRTSLKKGEDLFNRRYRRLGSGERLYRQRHGHSKKTDSPCWMLLHFTRGH